MVDRSEMPPAARAAASALGAEAVLSVLLAVVAGSGLLAGNGLQSLRPAARQVLFAKLGNARGKPEMTLAIEEEAAHRIDRIFDQAETLVLRRRSDS